MHMRVVLVVGTCALEFGESNKTLSGTLTYGYWGPTLRVKLEPPFLHFPQKLSMINLNVLPDDKFFIVPKTWVVHNVSFCE